jgi:DNA-binding PadR family transcriptional regulator
MALLKGTLDVLVLKTLSWTPMHAFEIATWIEERSDGRVQVDDAALLQALHRLEARMLVTADWGVTKNGRRARYYTLTPAGRALLKAESDRLVDHFDALVTILGARKA